MMTLWSQEELQGLSAHNAGHNRFRVYPERWFILLCTCLLALSNASQWISYLSITVTTDAFFCGEANEDNPDTCKIGYYSNQIFQFVGMATGILGLYITDKYGIRLSLWCGASFNMLGSMIRFAASFSQLSLPTRIATLHTGSVIAAMAQPFFLVLSPKVAEFWFPENQRALANVLSFVANPGGVVLGSMLPTLFVHPSTATRDSSDMLYLVSSLPHPALTLQNGASFALASFVLLLTACIRRSSPPTPPSPSSAHHNVYSLKEGLKSIFTSKTYVIFILPFGLAFAINWSVFVVTDMILETLNYGVGLFSKANLHAQHIAGYSTAVAAIAGVLSSIVAGSIVDRTKAFKEVICFCFAGIACTSIALDVLLHFCSNGSVWMTIVLIFLFVCLGSFCIPIFPIGLELAVEATFPVPEATSSGVLVVFAMAQMFSVSYIMDFLADYVTWYFVDFDFKRNFWLALDFWSLMSLVGLAIVFFCLKPEYKRLEFEQAAIVAADSEPQSGNPKTSDRQTHDL